MIADASIELVLTDPPWGRDGIALYDDIARQAARILKPGGSLIVYVGQIALPDALPAMAKHLRYFWCCADVRADSNSRIPNGVINGFVPLLWFVKEHRGDRQNYVRDVVINGGNPENLWHAWQQPLATAEHFIAALTSASGTVVDFMAGSARRLWPPAPLAENGWHSRATGTRRRVSARGCVTKPASSPSGVR